MMLAHPKVVRRRPFMHQRFLKPFRLTAAATLASVLVSLAVTWGALTAFDGPPPVIAYVLAVLIPAIFAPVVILPLALVLARLRRVSVELQSLALTDPLTGLPNRWAFFERAEVILAGSNAGRPVAAMMIDVDRFKAVNDEFGHAGGDALLMQIGKAIEKTVAASGAGSAVVARLGGEEFAILVSGLVPTAVARLADRLCLTGRQTKATIAGIDIASTVSIGVAMRTGRSGIDPLLKLADDAVYLAKRGGRDRWAFAGSHVSLPAGNDPRSTTLRRADRLSPPDMPPTAESNPPLVAN